MQFFRSAGGRAKRQVNRLAEVNLLDHGQLQLFLGDDLANKVNLHVC